MMNWFRMHHDARNDAKLRALTDAQFRVWFNLLCYASEQEERGKVLHYDPELLALEVSGGDVDLLETTLDRLVKLRMIDRAERENETVSFVNWDARQYDYPSAAPDATRERKRQQREREKQSQPVTSRHDKSPGVTIPVTTPEQNRTEQNRADSDQTRPDSEKTTTPAPPPATQAAVPADVGGGGGGFEEMVLVLGKRGCTRDEVQAAWVELQRSPPTKPVTNAAGYLYAVIQRHRRDGPTPTLPEAKPPETSPHAVVKAPPAEALFQHPPPKDMLEQLRSKIGREMPPGDCGEGQPGET